MAIDRRPLSLMLVAVTLISVGRWTLLAQSPSVPTTQPAQAVNPHWSSSRCKECHGPERPGKIAVERAEETCRRCHDGRQASQEVHPVGRLFVKGEVEKPKGWPAVSDRLGCLTCHDVRVACDHPGARSDANRTFLREPAAGVRGGFCGACHISAVEAKGGRYNPHEMLNAEGKPIRESCLFCHRSSLVLEGHTARTGNAILRNDGIGMCVGCHPRHADFFEPGHIGLVLTPDIKRRLMRTVRRQGSAPASQPADDVVTALPLDAGFRMMCATCHNPHPTGVFPTGSELSEGAMTKDSSNPLALRGPAKDVCRVCHNQ